ncbi:hypothetical protein ACQY0O_007468 [Thecaphora frezii]
MSSHEALPLLPGWTQHTAPTGHIYYFHSQTNTSTYTHPALANPPASGSSPRPSKADKPRKEKPRQKDPIPGAEGWLRITTNLGNVFYFHSPTKRSLWTVPDEIKEQVAAMQQISDGSNQLHSGSEGAGPSSADHAAVKESGGVSSRQDSKAEKDSKRKAEEGELITTFEAPTSSKRARIEPSTDADNESEQEEPGDGEENDDDDDEEWQRAMAAEMAAEAEQQEEAEGTSAPASLGAVPSKAGAPAAAGSGTPSAAGQGQPSAPSPSRGPFIPPPSVELSHDEAKALFMHMLTSLNFTSNEVNPMAPWDKELPKFVHQPAYSILPQLRDRQDAFNEWCKLRIREKRALKASAATSTTPRNGSTDTAHPAKSAPVDKAGVSAAAKFRQLLEAEVKSTRTRFDDFRKAWKKDRRFFDFGRDDREREKVFKQWLKELGERKRKIAMAAEAEFLDLLTSQLPSNLAADLPSLKDSNGGDEKAAISGLWQNAKRIPGLDTDRRYEAVGSSTRRAELFAEWLKGKRSAAPAAGVPAPTSNENHEAKVLSKEESMRRALQEREEKVRRERAAIEARNRAAFGAATKEESLIQFKQLLLDAIRDPLSGPMSSPAAQAKLASDPRYDAPGLTRREKEELYRERMEQLLSKRKEALWEVFRTHAPGLDAEEEDVLARVQEDGRMESASLRSYLEDRAALSREYDAWKGDWEVTARKEFFDMLKESAFIDFWGRMRQEALAKSSDEAGQDGDRQGEDEEEEEASLAEMAKRVDLAEFEAILRNDQRYRIWKHVPRKREEWIRVSGNKSFPKKMMGLHRKRYGQDTVC